MRRLEKAVELTHKNLLLRGSVLKNTEFVIGIVVYTGHNTKIMMNTVESGTNISNIERKLNNLILAILLFECICCGLSSIYSYICCVNNA